VLREHALTPGVDLDLPPNRKPRALEPEIEAANSAEQ